MNIKKLCLLSITLLPFLTGCGIGEGNEFQAQHNQGKNCLACHSFTSGATIYKSIHGANYDANDVADKYSIQLTLDTGEVLHYKKGNGYGNRLYNGDAGAINDFTPQVIDSKGNIVNQSSKNSHNVGRLACNRCHTKDGLSGAPGRIVNYDYFGTVKN